MPKSDRFLVRHSAISNVKNAGEPLLEGTEIGPADVPDGAWDRLVALGAVSPMTSDEVDARATSTAAKAATLAPDSPALTTGSDGGAPLDSAAAQQPANQPPPAGSPGSPDAAPKAGK